MLLERIFLQYQQILPALMLYQHPNQDGPGFYPMSKQILNWNLLSVSLIGWMEPQYFEC